MSKTKTNLPTIKPITIPIKAVVAREAAAKKPRTYDPVTDKFTQAYYDFLYQNITAEKGTEAYKKQRTKARALWAKHNNASENAAVAEPIVTEAAPVKKPKRSTF